MADYPEPRSSPLTATSPDDATQGEQDRMAESASRAAMVVLAGVALVLMIPVTLIVPGLKELISDRYGASAFWTHSFMWVNLLGATLAFPLIAMLADRVESRARMVSAALLADAALFAVMGAAPTLTALLCTRFLEGIAHMLALSTLMGLAADLAPANRRGRATGLVGAFLMFGTALGTRLGGLVWRAWPRYVFEAAAVAAVAAALIAWARLPDAAGRNARATPLDAWRLLRRETDLYIVYAYAFVERFCVGVVVSSFVLFLAQVHGIDPDGRSRLLATFLIPFAALVYPAGRLIDRIGSFWPITLASAMFGVVFASYGFVPQRGLPALMLLSGVCSAAMFAPTLALCAELSPVTQRGTAFAGFSAAGSLGFILGPAAGGLILQTATHASESLAAFRATFLVAGGLQLLVVVATVPALRRLRRRGRIR